MEGLPPDFDERLRKAVNDSVLSDTLSMVERHEHALMGNGKPGLLVQVGIMEDSLTRDLGLVNDKLDALSGQLVPLIEWKHDLVIKVAAVIAASSTISAILGAAASALVFYNTNLHPIVESLPKQ